MATFINRVHFFIALLCIASVLTSGGVIDGPPFMICIGQGPCPKGPDSACSLYCAKNHFNKGGRCEASKCCCYGGGPPSI
ncbi:LCR related CCP [Trifolium pratense]|uniref:LCR related CCP n=1 Tax=Trifolium pratense TaxID=57577 RepID=A0A2K3LZU4_TRIPR|nr:LCR related CCP [Trifolium pratense]